MSFNSPPAQSIDEEVAHHARHPGPMVVVGQQGVHVLDRALEDVLQQIVGVELRPA